MHATINSETQLGSARAEVVESLREVDASAEHLELVAVVTGELLTAALRAGVSPIALEVEPLRMLTSVRVRCPVGDDFFLEPMGIRDRILQGLTAAFGHRVNGDGTVDLWAEVERR